MRWSTHYSLDALEYSPLTIHHSPLTTHYSLDAMEYCLYFINGSNHADGKPPPYVSNHVGFTAPSSDGSWSIFFDGVDDWLSQ